VLAGFITGVMHLPMRSSQLETFGFDQSPLPPTVSVHLTINEKFDANLSMNRLFNRFPSPFRRQFWIDGAFVCQLYEKVIQAPRNVRTGRRELMFTIFDQKQLKLTRNCFCSSRSVRLSDNYHIFIALDPIAFSAFMPMHGAVLFLNLSGRGFAYYQFCRVKLVIQLLLLFWNVEATACDNDIVFLRNPKELFREESDCEATIEKPVLNFPRDYPWSLMNIGFMRVLPSQFTIALYQQWLIRALIHMGTLSQNALTQMLRNRQVYVLKSTAWFNVSEYVSGVHLFGWRYYDPLFVQNGAMMKRMVGRQGVQARQRNIREPYICHLSFVLPREKIKLFIESGLWFLTPDNETCGPLPDKRLYRVWKM
jgi:hypothetical protein